MIQSVLVINTSGKVRLAQFYVDIEYKRQQEIIKEVFQQVRKRPSQVCNFLERSPFGKNTMVVYRNFATLYFIVITDDSESYLGTLDLIRLYVECLDECFENVCELDLIFNADKCYYILGEIIQGGMVVEVNKEEIIYELSEQERRARNEPKTKSSSNTTPMKVVLTTTIGKIGSAMLKP